MEKVCAYCLVEYKRGERLDVGHLCLEHRIYDGEKTVGMHGIWLYKKPDADVLEGRGGSHGMCPFHFKLAMTP